MHRRLVTVGHMEQLQLGLDEAYGLQPRNKVAEAFGNVVSAIQVGDLPHMHARAPQPCMPHTRIASLYPGLWARPSSFF